MLLVMLLLLSVTSAFISVRAYSALPPSAALADVPVGPFPISMGYSPASGYVYTGSFTSGVSVVSGTRVIGSISSNDIGYIPRGFAYDSSNQVVYVAGGNRLSLISGANAVANGPNGGATPQAVVYNPSDDYVYVANLGSIVVLSSSNAMMANITTYTRPGGLVYDPLDDYTYASYIIQNGSGAQTGTEVYVMSGALLVGNVTLAGGGGGFVPPVYDACRNYVYLANTNLESVSVMWGTTLVGAVPVGQGPAALAYDGSDHYVYVANSIAGTVSVLSGTKVVGSVTVGSAPNAIAYDPHDGYVYVTNGGSGTVSVISGTTLIETVSVGKNPVAIVYNASNEDMYVANNGAATVSVIPSVGQAASNSGSSDCSPIRAAQTKTTVTYVAVAGGGRGEVVGVGAGVGLGDGEGHLELAGGEARQPPLLLGLGAELGDDGGADRRGDDDDQQRATGGGQLLGDHGEFGDPHAAAAEPLGHAHPEEPGIGHELESGEVAQLEAELSGAARRVEGKPRLRNLERELGELEARCHGALGEAHERLSLFEPQLESGTGP
jgi:YVTN family beta-propeller protein